MPGSARARAAAAARDICTGRRAAQWDQPLRLYSAPDEPGSCVAAVLHGLLAQRHHPPGPAGFRAFRHLCRGLGPAPWPRHRPGLRRGGPQCRLRRAQSWASVAPAARERDRPCFALLISACGSGTSPNIVFGPNVGPGSCAVAVLRDCSRKGIAPTGPAGFGAFRSFSLQVGRAPRPQPRRAGSTCPASRLPGPSPHMRGSRGPQVGCTSRPQARRAACVPRVAAFWPSPPVNCVPCGLRHSSRSILLAGDRGCMAR